MAKFTINELQKHIWEYKKRMQVFKIMYGDTDIYEQKSKPLHNKIRCWQATLRRMVKKRDVVNTLIANINEFFYVNLLELNVRYVREDRSKEQTLAKQVYFKYGIEVLGINGTELSERLNLKDKRTALRNRLALTKSFKINTKNKEKYHNFLKYAKQTNNRRIRNNKSRQRTN